MRQPLEGAVPEGRFGPPDPQRRAVHLQRGPLDARLALDGQVRPLLRLRQPGRSARTESVGRRIARPRDRHPAPVPRAVRAAAAVPGRVLTCLGWQVGDLGQAELLALVQVGGAGQREREQGRRPRPAKSAIQVDVVVRIDRGHARAVPDHVVVREHPRGGSPDPRVVRDGVVDGPLHLTRVPSGLEVAEVERRVQFVGSLVPGQALGVGHPGLAAEDPRRLELVGDGAPLAVDVVDAVLVPERCLGDVGVEHRRVVLGVRLGVGEVGQALLLDQPVGHVDAEAVDPPLEPEAQDVAELGVDLGVVPVEVRLGGVEQVQVPVAGRGSLRRAHVRPAAPVEDAAPVVRRRLVVVAPALADDVPIPGRGAGHAGQQLLEPRVLAAGVVRDDVHEDPDAAVMGLRDQFVDVGQRAEPRVDGAVVGDVVAAVVERRGVEGRDPDRVDAQVGQVVQARDQPGDVAHPVAIAVGEGAWVDLVDDGVTPPVVGGGRHGRTSFASKAFGGARPGCSASRTPR